MLLAVVPRNPPAGVLAAAQALQVAVERLETQWLSTARTGSIEAARPQDRRLDRAWSGVESGLDRYAIFDADPVDRERAAQIHRRLFPGGLDFIRLPYVEQHAQSDLRLAIIERDGLRGDLVRLVGEGFVRELWVAHRAYGVALGLADGGEGPPPVSLAIPLRALDRAICSYAHQVLAFADRDRRRNTAVARRALEPIDVTRRARAGRNTGHGKVLGQPQDTTIDSTAA